MTRLTREFAFMTFSFTFRFGALAGSAQIKKRVFVPGACQKRPMQCLARLAAESPPTVKFAERGMTGMESFPLEPFRVVGLDARFHSWSGLRWRRVFELNLHTTPPMQFVRQQGALYANDSRAKIDAIAASAARMV